MIFSSELSAEVILKKLQSNSKNPMLKEQVDMTTLKKQFGSNFTPIIPAKKAKIFCFFRIYVRIRLV
ncbi:MAG: hypothetical protein A3F41_04335 [Coxiella sp. RIFCSPHIGHO2_12_FULL_44_14]|nr:MAG: hypothetical protein A3F41_04335 [Coxiella sp. RIFCSPHIGHO2_12_FULL_44_14]